MGEAVEYGPQGEPLTPFRNVSVQQVISRLAQHVIEKPDSPDSASNLTALVRFFNFNLWIQGIER